MGEVLPLGNKVEGLVDQMGFLVDQMDLVEDKVGLVEDQVGLTVDEMVEQVANLNLMKMVEQALQAVVIEGHPGGIISVSLISLSAFLSVVAEQTMKKRKGKVSLILAEAQEHGLEH